MNTIITCFLQVFFVPVFFPDDHRTGLIQEQEQQQIREEIARFLKTTAIAQHYIPKQQ